MEWFARPDGSVAVSEVGARPPGAQLASMIGFSHDVDFYSMWAELVLLGTFDPPERVYATGTAYLRGQGRGQVRTVHGVDELQREIGHLVVDAKLPAPGQPASTSYEGEGFVTVRHEDTAVVEDALDRIIHAGSRVGARRGGLMPNVVMLSPGFPLEMAYFTRALAQTGATVIGVGDQPLRRAAARGAATPGPLRARLAGRRGRGAGALCAAWPGTRGSTRWSACGSRTWCSPPGSARSSACRG